MDYLKKKEELENKINEINTHWKDLETTHQKELKKRHDEYQEDKPIKKSHLFNTAKRLLFELKIRSLIYMMIYISIMNKIFFIVKIINMNSFMKVIF